MRTGDRGTRRLLSADEAESVLERHLRTGFVDARIRSGTFVVHWWPTDDDDYDVALDVRRGQALAGPAGAESALSFEDAIRELARRRPDLVVEPLDAPQGRLAALLADEPELDAAGGEAATGAAPL